MTHIPLNTTAVTDKVSRSLAGAGLTPAISPARGLAAALAGNTTQPQESQPQPESTVDGTGFGLSPDPAPTKAPATDPSQGRGNRRPRVTDDPIMQAFQRMGIA